jgi:hypothetical protein
VLDRGVGRHLHAVLRGEGCVYLATARAATATADLLRRAVEHADGWTPFKGDPDHIREARRRAEDYGLPAGQPFDISMPLGRGVHREDGLLDIDSILRKSEAYAEAGATSLRVGFRAATPGEYVSKMEIFARDVIARF